MTYMENYLKYLNHEIVLPIGINIFSRRMDIILSYFGVYPSSLPFNNKKEETTMVEFFREHSPFNLNESALKEHGKLDVCYAPFTLRKDNDEVMLLPLMNKELSEDGTWNNRNIGSVYFFPETNTRQGFAVLFTKQRNFYAAIDCLAKVVSSTIDCINEKGRGHFYIDRGGVRDIERLKRLTDPVFEEAPIKDIGLFCECQQDLLKDVGVGIVCDHYHGHWVRFPKNTHPTTLENHDLHKTDAMKDLMSKINATVEEHGITYGLALQELNKQYRELDVLP